MTTLDIGCGDFKRGEVGLDKTRQHGVDVVCDIEEYSTRIPFAANSFDKVVSHHSLEHMTDPEAVLVEMLRVSRGKVEVTVPHRYGKLAHGKRFPEHVNVFSVRWFTAFAKKYDLAIRTHMTYHPFLLVLQRPHEIIVELRKFPSKKCVCAQQ